MLSAAMVIFQLSTSPTEKSIWTMNVLKKFGGEQITWGISESPLIVGEKILVNPGGPGASIVALNKKDGSLIWKSQSEKAGYSSAIALEAAGTPQVVFFTSTRAVGLDLKDGRLLWEYGKPVESGRKRRNTDRARQPDFHFLRLRHRWRRS